VDEAFAKKFFPSENPIGKVVQFRYEPYKVEEEHPRLIIGVVGNVKFWRQSRDVFPIAYASMLQQPRIFPGGRSSAHLRRRLLLRCTGDPSPGLAHLVSAVKTIISQEDKTVPVNRVKTMDELLAHTELFITYITRLLAIFGLIAATLAGVGIYGVMSYAVSERTNEIGIRVALGADRTSVVYMIVRKSFRLALVGIAGGVLASIALTRLVASLLFFGVQPWDPPTLTAVATVLIFVASIASYVPARRASGLDPTVALRHQ
jgi:hypothetical protein